MRRAAFACLLFCLSLALAQTSTDQLLAEALAKAETAKTTYQVATYDQPLWREAILLATQAANQSPNNVQVLHFLGAAYTYVHWYSRAWDNWLAFFAAGGTVELAKQFDANSVQLIEDAGTELGYARYQAGSSREALAYYEKVLEFLPDDAEALRWAGRIHLELDETEASLPYWRRLAEVTPNDPSVKYYIMLAEQQDQVGREASSAFQKGLQAYDENKISEAQGFFEAAVRANTNFKDALAWAGRTSFELNQLELASSYWQKVLAIDPNDETAAYFARYASDRETWGAAADAFYQGQTLHLQGNYAEAVKQFEEAYRLNPNYKDAAVWTARTYQEMNDPARAKPYWEIVLRLDPGDKRAQDFLRLAEVQASAGVAAGSAFLEGVAAFEAARLADAEASFQRALAENPNFADAWAWLGRVHFSLGDYAKAADEYGKAYQLNPNNDAYRYFANESLRLQSNP
ncbi:MAG: tetratricopeptide repeat protein [Trueperaceae bacterium]|nr:tetratricopeptide repeat protein [Trueperaceae bacterium]